MALSILQASSPGMCRACTPCLLIGRQKDVDARDKRA
jgi:hypothetical protein